MVAVKVMTVDRTGASLDPHQHQQLVHLPRAPCLSRVMTPPSSPLEVVGGNAAPPPLIDEGWINASLRHPNVVTLYTALTVLRHNGPPVGGTRLTER